MKKNILMIGIVMILLVGCSIQTTPIINENIKNISLHNDSNLFVMGTVPIVEYFLSFDCGDTKIVLDYGDFTINRTMKDICDIIK